MTGVATPRRDEPRESFLNRPWVKIVLAPLGVYVIGEIINRVLPGLHLFAGIGKFFVWLYSAKVPLLLFLVPVASTVFLLYVVARQGHKQKTSLAGLETQAVPSSPKPLEKKMESLAVNLEHLAILAALGEAKGDLTDDQLFNYYLRQFQEKSRIHFKLIIDELQKYDMIVVTNNIYGEKYYVVTSKGLEVIRERLGSAKTG